MAGSGAPPGRALRAGAVTDLAVVTQDHGSAAERSALLHAFPARRGAARPRVAGSPDAVPASRRLSRPVSAGRASRRRRPRGPQCLGRRRCRPVWYPATRSGRPYAAWIGTSLEDEWTRGAAGCRFPAASLSPPTPPCRGGSSERCYGTQAVSTRSSCLAAHDRRGGGTSRRAGRHPAHPRRRGRVPS